MEASEEHVITGDEIQEMLLTTMKWGVCELFVTVVNAGACHFSLQLGYDDGCQLVDAQLSIFQNAEFQVRLADSPTF